MRRSHPFILTCAVLAVPLSGQRTGPRLGSKVPPITLEAMTNAPEGARGTWNAFGDKIVVLTFWGTW